MSEGSTPDLRKAPPMALHIDEDRIARIQEPILDPDQPIIDPHHHMMDHNHSYLHRELFADLASGHRVYATVHLQCRSMYDADLPAAEAPIGETSFAAGVAAMAASGKYGPQRACAGIVGYVDLLTGAAVRPVLEKHIEAGAGRFRGIRYGTATHSDRRLSLVPFEIPAELMASGRFREGIAQLAPLGLSFDAMVLFTQIDELADLARAFPNTIFVLNHCGFPCASGPYEGQRDEVLTIWAAAMRRLAELPNVVVKVSALGLSKFLGFDFHAPNPAAGSDALAEAWSPIVLRTIEIFGPDRCMFGSNFPVDKESASYRTLWNAYKRIVVDFSAEEKNALFHRTAARAYRLEAASSVLDQSGAAA